MTTWKNIALTRQIFVGKVMSLLFNIDHSFPSKEQVSFNFMAAITICSDFGASQNKVWHCFHCFPIYFPWSDGTRWSLLPYCFLSGKSAHWCEWGESLLLFTSISSLVSDSICFIYLGAPALDAYMLMKCIYVDKRRIHSWSSSGRWQFRITP